MSIPTDRGPIRAATPYRFVSPARLMLGASYTFGRRAILSVDYQRDWYNGIRVKQTPFWIPDEAAYARSTLKRKFRATNTLRIGAEVKPLDRLALRAGFACTSSMVRHAELTGSAPLAERVCYYTAGVGFALSRRVSLDAAYQYCKTENSAYRLFYAAERTGTPSPTSTPRSPFRPTTHATTSPFRSG